MSAQAGRAVIDSCEFARKGESLSGELPVATLARLKESLHDDSGSILYAVRGGCDGRGRPTLAIEVSGVLRLRCQRCLGAMEFPLRLATTLAVVDAARINAAGSDDDDLEWVESSPELDVAGLVEDEIILGMPFSARHADGECRDGDPASVAGAGGRAGAAEFGRGAG